MSVRSQILLHLGMAYWCIILAIYFTMLIAIAGYRGMLENNDVLIVSAVVSIMGLLSQNQYQAGMQALNPNSAFAAEGENERRAKYLPYFLWRPFKHMPNILIIVGILMATWAGYTQATVASIPQWPSGSK